MANNLINASELLEKINTLWSEHAKLINQANEPLQKYTNLAKLPSNYAKNLQEVTDVSNKLRKSTDELTKTEKQLQAQQKADVILRNKRIKAFEKQDKAIAREQKALERTSGLYNKVQQRVKSLTLQYNQLATKKALGQKLTTSELSGLKQITLQLNKYDAVLKKVDADVGKHQRNVGNYKSAYDGLGFSITQLAREAPAFANSVQTGFMAISNNLPMLFDEIAKTKREVASLRAEGIQTSGTFARLAKSIFSFQTLLSVGVTLLTLYGKDIVNFISDLIKGDNAVTSLADGFRGLGDEAKTSIGRLKGLIGVTQDLTRTDEERLRAIKDINDEYPTFNTNILEEKDNLELVNKEVEKYIGLLISRARVKQSEAKIGGLVQEQLDLEESILKRQKDISDERQSQLRTLVKGIVETRKLENSDKERLKAISEYDKIYSSASFSEQILLKAYEKELYLKEKIQKETSNIVNNTIDEEESIKGTVKYYESLISANNQLIKEKKTLNELSDVRKLQAENKQYQRQIDLILGTKNGTVDRIDVLKVNAKETQSLSEIIREHIKVLTDARDMTLGGSQEYAVLTKEIEKYNDILNGTIKTTDLLLDSEYLSRVKSAQDGVKAREEAEKKKTEITAYYAKQREEIEREVEQNVRELINASVDAMFQKKLDNYEREGQLLNKTEERALSNTQLSEEAQIEIKRQAQVKRDEIEKKKAETERKAFLLKQAFEFAEITISTIKAVAQLKAQASILLANPITAPLAPIALGQIPLVITSGAIAGATVLAQTIPAFKDGVIGFEGGQAIVGDGGKHEYIRTPDGTVTKTPKTDTLVNLPKGTDVFKDENAFMSSLNKELGINGISPLSNILSRSIMPNITNKGISKEDLKEVFSNEISKLNNTIKNKSETSFNFDEKGFNTFITSRGGKTKVLNARVTGRGKTNR